MERKITGRVTEIVKFLNAVETAMTGVAEAVSLATPLTFKWTGEFTVGGKQEDYKYPCCENKYGKPTIFDTSKYSISVGGERTFIGKKTVGVSLILSAIPPTKLLEKWSHIGDRIDKVLAKTGGSCNLRVLAEGNAAGSFNNWSPAPPCLTCAQDFSLSGSALAGGGVSCSYGPSPVLVPAPPIKPTVELVTASLQGWAKLAPIGYSEACANQSKWTWGSPDICFQYRVRFYDWLDTEGQWCVSRLGNVVGTKFGF